VAIRADAVELFGPRATARAGITRTLRGDAASGRWLAVRVGGGTSFRPPTFDDLFWPARAGAVGNPDLEPERSRDLDLGVEAQTKVARLHVSAFHSEVRDLIQWTPGPDGIWRPHNVSRARIRGAEFDGALEGRVKRVPVRLDLTFSWLDATDGTDDRLTGGKQLVGRARYTGYGELSLELGRWTVASGIRAVSLVPLTAANTKWAEGYALLHGRLRWKVSRHLRIDLEGQNLTDTVYEDIRGYATPGRQLQIGLRYAPERNAS
jgi:outer membrane cobalamin receptor